MVDHDMSQISTEALAKELHNRREKEQAEEREAVRLAYPCPRCGGDPREVSLEMVEDFVFAPRDQDGGPMLYAPYEMGETHGARWERVVTCENGHTSRTSEIKWFDKPVSGPILPRR